MPVSQVSSIMKRAHPLSFLLRSSSGHFQLDRVFPCAARLSLSFVSVGIAEKPSLESALPGQMVAQFHGFFASWQPPSSNPASYAFHRQCLRIIFQCLSKSAYVTNQKDCPPRSISEISDSYLEQFSSFFPSIS